MKSAEFAEITAQETRKNAQNTTDIPESCAILEELALEAGVSAEQLAPDAMTEEEWPAVYHAGHRMLSGPWQGNKEKLRNLMLEIDAQYVEFAERMVMKRQRVA